MRIEGRTAYVQTVDEAFSVIDSTGVDDVVIENNAERIKMQRIIKALGALRP